MAEMCVFCRKKFGVMDVPRKVTTVSEALICSKCMVTYKIPLFDLVKTGSAEAIDDKIAWIKQQTKNDSIRLDEALNDILHEAKTEVAKEKKAQERRAWRNASKADVRRLFEQIRAFPVTTEDIKCNYRVVSPIIYNVTNKGVFSSAYDALSMKYDNDPHNILIVKPDRESPFGSDLGVLFLSLMDTSGQFEGSVGQRHFDRAFYIGLAEMKLRAAEMGANAIVGLRMDFDLDTTNFGAFYLQMYGTAVLIEE